MKKKIQISERELTQFITESVHRIISEGDYKKKLRQLNRRRMDESDESAVKEMEHKLSQLSDEAKVEIYLKVSNLTNDLMSFAYDMEEGLSYQKEELDRFIEFFEDIDFENFDKDEPYLIRDTRWTEWYSCESNQVVHLFDESIDTIARVVVENIDEFDGLGLDDQDEE